MDGLGLLTNMASGVPQGLLGGAAIGTVLCLEVPRRVAGIRIETLGVRQCARSCAQVLVGCAPEVFGLCVLLVVALVLRLRGDTEIMPDLVTKQVWEQIKVEWPILMGADTLLNLQAMLRLLVLLFVGMRAQAKGRSPLSGLPALLFLAGAVTRATLSCRTDAYRLEGPLSLGGDLPVACELAGVAFWAALGRTASRRTQVIAAGMVSWAMWFGSHHYLNLAKDPSVDQLFVQAHMLEFLAAFAYVVRSFSLMVGDEDAAVEDGEGSSSKSLLQRFSDWRSNAFVGFMHIVMTLQQALSAYYFLTAFEPHSSLVGSGRPFCVLCIGNLLQLGAFLCAAAFFVGGVDFSSEIQAALPGDDGLRLPGTETEVLQDEDAGIETEVPGTETELIQAPLLEDDEASVPSGPLGIGSNQSKGAVPDAMEE